MLLAKGYTNRSVDRLREDLIDDGVQEERKDDNNDSCAHRNYNKESDDKSMVDDMFKPGTKVYQHVDDLSQLMWHDSDAELAKSAAPIVKQWAIDIRDKLKMECSDKNVIIPPGMPARVVQKALLEQGVVVRIAAHGKDVGVDVTAGKKKKTKTLKDRANAATKRARNINELI